MADEPIEELEYLGGVTVVDFGEVRVSRGMTRRPRSTCAHSSRSYDNQERRIWCRDCETDLDAFDAFIALLEPYDRSLKKLKKDRKHLDETMGFQLRSRAARSLDEAWRKRATVPACPKCRSALLPEDFKNGVRLEVRKPTIEE